MLFWLVNLLYVLTTTLVLIYCKNLCRYDFWHWGKDTLRIHYQINTLGKILGRHNRGPKVKWSLKARS